MTKRKKAAPLPAVAEPSTVWAIDASTIDRAMAETTLFGTAKVEVPAWSRWLCELPASDVAQPVYAPTFWDARVAFAKFLAGIGQHVPPHDPAMRCTRAT